MIISNLRMSSHCSLFMRTKLIRFKNAWGSRNVLPRLTENSYSTTNKLLKLQLQTQTCSVLGRNKLPVMRTEWKCDFHTSQRRNIPPVIITAVKIIMKIGGIIHGRGLRKKLKDMPDKKERFIGFIKKWGKWIAVAIGTLCIAAYSFYRMHLEASPIIGRERFIAFTDDQFMKIMQYEVEKVNEELKGRLLPIDHPYYTVAVNVIKTLVSANKDIKEVQKTTWTVAIIDDPDVNAMVLPTGHVFIHKGLMDFVMNSDQLAIILGHEMAHALLKHAAEQLSQSHLVDYATILFMTVLWAFIPTDGIALITDWFLNKTVKTIVQLPYGRNLEMEADKVGLELAAKACYDIRCGTVFWRLMEMKDNVKGDDIPEWLSTHPLSGKRAELFDHLIPKYTDVRCKCNCPPLPDKDPREILPYVKSAVDNHITSMKSRGNIERLKIPLSKYRIETPPAALAGNNLTDNQSDVSVEIMEAVRLHKDTKTTDNATMDNAQESSSSVQNTDTTSKAMSEESLNPNQSIEALQDVKILSDNIESVKLLQDTNTSNVISNSSIQ